MASRKSDFEPERTALLLIDLQNDIVTEKGAFGRAGHMPPEAMGLGQRLRPLAEQIRASGGWIVSTHFTLVPDKRGEPFISDYMKGLRPFLGKGDLVAGSWGHKLIDDLAPADIAVEKIALSAFYMTRLEWVLRRADIATLLVAGFSTNGSVSSTVRDATLRDFKVFVLEDGCAAFPPEAHRAAIGDLATLATVRQIKDIAALLKP